VRPLLTHHTCCRESPHSQAGPRNHERMLLNNKEILERQPHAKNSNIRKSHFNVEPATPHVLSAEKTT